MATIDQIHQIRVAVKDPYDIIDIQTVTDQSALPDTPALQTAYYDTARGVYWITKTVKDAMRYEIARLRVGDKKITSIIDSVGVELGECRTLHLLARELGEEMRVVRLSVGIDSTQFQTVDSMYKYYNAMANNCEKSVEDDIKRKQGVDQSSTGGFYRTSKPTIAGGLI